MTELTRLEKKLLLNLAGKEDTITSWGAWVGACREALLEMGLITRLGQLTPTGQQLAEDLSNENRDL